MDIYVRRVCNVTSSSKQGVESRIITTIHTKLTVTFNYGYHQKSIIIISDIRPTTSSTIIIADLLITMYACKGLQCILLITIFLQLVTLGLNIFFVREDAHIYANIM